MEEEAEVACDNDDRMRLALHQLVMMAQRHFDAVPTEQPLPPAETVVSDLEATDLNFHSYEVVRELSHRVESNVGTLLDNLVSRIPSDGGGADTLLPEIVDQIKGTDEFAALIDGIKTDLQMASASVIDDIEEGREEDNVKSPRHDSSTSKTSGGSLALSAASGMSGSQSSLSEQDLDFSGEKELGAVLQKLGDSGDPQGQLEAANILFWLSPSELYGHSLWNEVITGIMQQRRCDHVLVRTSCLQVLAKLYRSASGQDVCTIFQALVKHIEVHARNASPMVFADLLQEVRLFSQVLCDVTNIWMRYQSDWVSGMISATVKTLCTPIGNGKVTMESVDGSGPVLVLHLVALFDMKAEWFTGWTHAWRSRKILLECIAENALVARCLSMCVNWSRMFQDDSCYDESTQEPQRAFVQLLENCAELQLTPVSLSYCGFFHCLHILSHLLVYTRGRNIFPLKLTYLKDKHISFSTEDCLLHLVALMYTLPFTKVNATCAGSIVECVGRVLIQLASGGESGCSLLCTGRVLSAMVTPLSLYVSSKQGSNSSLNSALLFTADVLALLACRQVGRNALLCAKLVHNDNTKVPSVGWMLGNFASDAMKALLNEDGRKTAKGAMAAGHSKSNFPRYVVSAFLFVCRQLYNTCRGLRELESFQLNLLMGKAFAKDKALATHNVVHNDDGTTAPVCVRLDTFSEMLLDHLLNFAGTPKGIQLLHQTGMLENCVTYMFERFKKKMQVSKCEKFGYGVMVLQLAATAPGMVALHNVGYVRRIVQDLWLTVCGGEDDLRLVTAYTDPMDPMDRSVYKVMLQLVALVTPFDGLVQLLHGPKPVLHDDDTPVMAKPKLGGGNERWRCAKPWKPFRLWPEMEQCQEVTETIESLFRIALSSMPTEPIAMVFNFRHMEHCVLRLVSLAVTCLDSLILMEVHYDMRRTLLTLQAGCRMDEYSGFLMDAAALERNHILVATASVGGPSERIIPPREINDLSWKDANKKFRELHNPFKWPLFSEDPIPREYVIKQKEASPAVSVSEFLQKKLLRCSSTPPQSTVRDVFADALRKGKICGSADLLALVNSAMGSLPARPNSQPVPAEFMQPYSSITTEQASQCTGLNEYYKFGVRLAVRYGVALGKLKEEEKSAEDLEQLLNMLSRCLGVMNGIEKAAAEMSSCSGKFHGFDWFVASMFIMCAGNCAATWSFLLAFSGRAGAESVWCQRILPKNQATHISCKFSVIAHCVEFIVQDKYPLLRSAFQLSGCTPAQVSYQWLNQCYWNYLDWPDIELYLATCIVMGADYQVYFAVAILHGLHGRILQETKRQRLLPALKESLLLDFHLTPSVLRFMRDLETIYRDYIFSCLHSSASDGGVDEITTKIRKTDVRN
ncbi:protein broad-minded-like [Sycon ciliatum]|uniref:protein broad-minded-like n=1 Tax=Sycon ciliatum TaxID=27933 RepID=UPI0031F6C4C1